MEAAEDEGLMMTPRVDAAVDVDSPLSEVVDGEFGGCGALRDDDEIEVFEEAVDGIPLPSVLWRQYGDVVNVDGDVLDPSVLDRQHQLLGESQVSAADEGNGGIVDGFVAQKEMDNIFSRESFIGNSGNVEGSLGEVDREAIIKEILREVEANEVEASQGNIFKEIDTKQESVVPSLERQETDQDYDRIESDAVNAENGKNENYNNFSLIDGEKCVSNGSVGHEDSAAQLQDDFAAVETVDNLQRSFDDNVDAQTEVRLYGLSKVTESDDKESKDDNLQRSFDDNVDAQTDVRLHDLSKGTESDDKESKDDNLQRSFDDNVDAQTEVCLHDLSKGTESDDKDSKDDGQLNTSSDAVDAPHDEHLRNYIDRSEVSEFERSRALVSKQAEEKLGLDAGKQNFREQVEINNESQESVTVEDIYESSSNNDNGESKRLTSIVSAREDQLSGSFLPSHPAGLGSSDPLLQPSGRTVQHSRVNGSAAQRQSTVSEDAASTEVEYNETREKLQMIRVKFLRLAYRLGQTPHNVVVAQVLYRLGLAEQLRGSASRVGSFSFDRASAMAEQLESAGQEPLDFSCTIMVIGKTGVGKSATINSIFGELKFKTDAFSLGTKKVQDAVGMVQGIKVRVVDTPGLLPSPSDQSKNEMILKSVKNFIKNTPPDVIMYLDRLDMQNRDMGDIPLLRSITNVFGPSFWFNAIVVLTHAASAPPEGANGSSLNYDMYVSQRTHVIQNAIRHAAGDLRLLNPVSLVENHSACRTNRAGQRVLPTGQVWKPHLLLLSFASKILTEANTLLRLQDSPSGRPFSARSRTPPLPFFLSSLLQSKPQLKLPDEQFCDEDGMDIFMDKETDSGDETDYDDLPPFRSLTREQLSHLSNTQRKAYYEEIDYRERLLFRKQMREEKKRQFLRKKMAAESAEEVHSRPNTENIDDESGGPATVPVPMPDISLPASFDSDYPSHRYRFLDSSQWLVKPVLETQGWDHDVGYDGVNAEKMFILKDKIPVSVSGQLLKDKKECSLQMELASSIKHGETKASSLSMDLQTVGKDMAYTLRGETRVSNFKRNSMLAAVSATLLGDTTSAGLKIEERLLVNKMVKLLVSGGVMMGCGEAAYGGRLEATLRDMDYPIGKKLTTLALSLVDWHGDLAIAGNLLSQIPIGHNTNLIGNANWSNRGTGQLGIRLNSSEQLQIALIALIPLFRNLKKFLGTRE